MLLGKETLIMLLFLRATPKSEASQSPSVKFLEQVVKEWETVIDYKKQGKVLEVFRFADGSGAFSIWDVVSVEELENIVTGLPMYPFAAWEIIPLLTAEETLTTAKQALESLKSSG